MLRTERENKILTLLEKDGYISVKVLGEMLFTSESSIRRDLTRLEDAGLIKRSYGGAELIPSNKKPLPFSTRAHNGISEKRIIAKKAVTLVGEGAVIFLDASSSSYFLALELMERGDVTVATNSVEVLEILSKGKPVVHSSGGVLSACNRTCFVGRAAERGFEEMNADIVFFSAKSIGLDGVISDCTQEEVFVRHAMMKNAALKVGLFDKSKVGTTAPFKQCGAGDIDIIICDEPKEAACFSDFCKIL